MAVELFSEEAIQRCLLKNYGNLMSLGIPFSKPALVIWLQQGKEPRARRKNICLAAVWQIQRQKVHLIHPPLCPCAGGTCVSVCCEITTFQAAQACVQGPSKQWISAQHSQSSSSNHSLSHERFWNDSVEGEDREGGSKSFREDEGEN